MLSNALAVLAFGAICGVWMVFQRWIESVDPEVRPVSTCGSCEDGRCSGHCEPDPHLTASPSPSPSPPAPAPAPDVGPRRFSRLRRGGRR